MYIRKKQNKTKANRNRNHKQTLLTSSYLICSTPSLFQSLHCLPENYQSHYLSHSVPCLEESRHVQTSMATPAALLEITEHSQICTPLPKKERWPQMKTVSGQLHIYGWPCVAQNRFSSLPLFGNGLKVQPDVFMENSSFSHKCFQFKYVCFDSTLLQMENIHFFFLSSGDRQWTLANLIENDYQCRQNFSESCVSIRIFKR